MLKLSLVQNYKSIVSKNETTASQIADQAVCRATEASAAIRVFRLHHPSFGDDRLVAP